MLLSAVPLAYDLPLLRLGTADANMVRHFDDDEWLIYNAWGTTYTHGPLYADTFDIGQSYPKLFFNTAGVILYPYSNAAGDNVTTIVTTLRSFNILFGIGAVFVLFFLVRRVLRSNLIALIAAGLFALTPQFLVWTVNSRPNPLEWMLIFVSLFVLVRMCERFSFKLFLVATLAGALAFATKFGATPILILVPMVSVYLIWMQRGDPIRFLEILQEQARFYRYLLPVLAAIMVAGTVFLIWALRSNGWDGVSLAYNWTQGGFQSWRWPKLLEVLESHRVLVNGAAWGGVVGLAVGTVLVMYMRGTFREWASSNGIQPRTSIFATLFVGFIIVSGVAYTVVFFAVGPAYIVNPEHFFSQVGFEFRYLAFGVAYGDAGKPGYIDFLRSVGNQFHSGWWAFVPLIVYAAYLNVRGINFSPVQRDQRLVLWVFVLITLSLFLGSKSAPSLRHILPIVGILYIFMAEAMVIEFRRWKYSRTAGVLAVALTALMIIGFGTHSRAAYSDWSQFRLKPQDTGLQVGDWLQNQYPEDTRLMTDYIRFYVPPSFTQVATTTTAEWDRYRGADVKQSVIDLIVSFDPEVLVLSHPQQFGESVNVYPLLESDEILKSRNYRLVKEFEYQRPDQQRYNYKQVLVYEKGEISAETSLDSNSPDLR